MENREARVVFAFIRGRRVSDLAPVVLAAVPLLHLDLLRVFLRLLDVLERGQERGGHCGSESLGGRVHRDPLLGRGYGRPNFLEFKICWGMSIKTK